MQTYHNPPKESAFNLKQWEMNYEFEIMAERTGLEPATPGVTGRYSNQLNYRSADVVKGLHYCVSAGAMIRIS